ncbi:hypothetical protein Rhopal_002803-T1 [Rhodotorula paludigena]|uniref:Glyoxalase-like domain-containing protein n=1 Tax=Rhodotorula paludigena TaxID=86838 RepID=A0AAV5GGY2_9BASI|nr:hypothetical protein Rhopal_002803-T1 [Rhodotorula paludigena]
MAPALDHVIILVPHDVLHNLPTSLTSAFTVTPGGTHADGLTENKLVIFEDGAYLELIAFVPGVEPSKRDSHWWGRKQAGIIDFALTSPAVLERFPSSYNPPVAGGRQRPDGEEVKWVVTFPKPTFERGAIPFWCHDTTPRELRVPNDAAKTTHPSGATGVAGLTVRIPAEAYDEAVKAYVELLGTPGEAVEEGEGRAFEYTTVADEDEAVSIHLLKGEGSAVTFDEVVVRSRDKGIFSGTLMEENVDGELLRVRFV